jgi:hypothetical protein
MNFSQAGRACATNRPGSIYFSSGFFFSSSGFFAGFGCAGFGSSFFG